MNKVLVNETSLISIADAIREKNGTTDTYKPSEMPAAIAAIEVGGGEDKVPNPILIEGANGDSAFKSKAWNWVIDNYRNRIETKDLTKCQDMFYCNTEIENIDFDFNFSISDKANCASMFYGCQYLKSINGEINNLQVDTMRYMFNNCNRLRELPKFNNYIFNSSNAMAFGDVFAHCYSLRSIPEDLLKQMGSDYVYNTNGTIYNTFYALYTIDEIVGIPTKTKEMTNNSFTSNFRCHRAKRFVFDTNNGVPYQVSWKNQTIKLYDGFGWLNQADRYITEYNSGITADKKVVGEATYEALKNDADWYSGMVEYSRFNHTSAVEMINSLPDTSAYIAANGGTNTIYLRNQAGEQTDGGKIGNLTEEEIAIAAAKGWTITYKT